MYILLRRLRRDRRAQDLAEYGIALGVIAVGVGVIAVAIGGDIVTIWTTAQAAIAAG